MVRALASHQCGPGSIPGPGVICRLSLCWFSTLLRGFFSGCSGFPPSAKTDTQLIRAGCWLCSKVMHGPYSGCQRGLYMLSVRPCRAASLLYFARAISKTELYYYYYEALVSYNQFADMFCDLMVTNFKDSREDTLSIFGSQVHLVQLNHTHICIVFLKERGKPFYPLSPNINIHILPTILLIFLMLLVGRI